MKTTSRSELSLKPNLTEFVKMKYWAIHEAVFLLTEWPKYNMFMTTISPLPADVKEDRSYFYHPEGDFNPNNYSLNFQRVFFDLKIAIEAGALSAKQCYVCPGIVWLVSPDDVLSWAVRNGMCFPMDLQKAFGCYVKSVKLSKPTQNSIKNKIITQFLLIENPINTAANIAKDPLMMKYGTAHPKRVPTAIFEDINAVYGNKGKGGKRSRPIYKPECIPEICETDSVGTVVYHYPSFELAIKTLLEVYLDRLGGIGGFTDLDRHFDEFLNLDIVRLYMDSAPKVIQKLAGNFCGGFLYDIFGMMQLYMQTNESFNVTLKA